MFAKGWQFLFCFFLLLAMFDLARRRSGAGHLAGLLITYALLVGLLRFRFLASGYADVPVAFMAYSAVYALLVARDTTDARRRRKYVLLGAVLCAGAALTKQAGLLVAAVYPLLAWLLVDRAAGAADDAAARSAAIRPGPGNGRAALVHAAILAAMLLALIAPWYVCKQMAIHHRADDALAARLLFDMHAGRNMAGRLLHAGELLRGAIGLPAAAALVVAVGWAMRDAVQRWLVALVAAPFTLVWTLGFSYDLRNLALVLPLVGMAAGIGVVELAGVLRRSRATTADSARLPEGPVLCRGDRDNGKAWVNSTFWGNQGILSLRLGHLSALLAVAMAVPMVLVGVRFGREELARRQCRLQRAVGRSDLNAMLYAAVGDGSGDRGIDRPGAIATDYLPLQWVPGLQQRYAACRPESLAAFLAVYGRPEVGFALVHQDHTAAGVWRYLAEAESRGNCRLLGQAGHYCLYQKREDRARTGPKDSQCQEDQRCKSRSLEDRLCQKRGGR
jgi:hypothetical protein